jgi:hypothetical protein
MQSRSHEKKTQFVNYHQLYDRRHAIEGAPMKNDKVVHGYLDVLDYTKGIAQLRFIGESNKTCTFKFSTVWVEALRDYWGDKVRCLIDNKNKLQHIDRIAARLFK